MKIYERHYQGRGFAVEAETEEAANYALDRAIEGYKTDLELSSQSPEELASKWVQEYTDKQLNHCRKCDGLLIDKQDRVKSGLFSSWVSPYKQCTVCGNQQEPAQPYHQGQFEVYLAKAERMIKRAKERVETTTNRNGGNDE